MMIDDLHPSVLSYCSLIGSSGPWPDIARSHLLRGQHFRAIRLETSRLRGRGLAERLALQKVADPQTKLKVSQTCGKLPLQFDANQVRTDGDVKFIPGCSGNTLFLDVCPEAIYETASNRI